MAALGEPATRTGVDIFHRYGKSDASRRNNDLFYPLYLPSLNPSHRPSPGIASDLSFLECCVLPHESQSSIPPKNPARRVISSLFPPPPPDAERAGRLAPVADLEIDSAESSGGDEAWDDALLTTGSDGPWMGSDGGDAGGRVGSAPLALESELLLFAAGFGVDDLSFLGTRGQ
jgi:hypothetical protein